LTADVHRRMGEEWDQRAREDPYYYVAFGRRGQSEEEFFATAEEVVRGLERELKRLPAGNRRAWRALEIGCGPGRLLRPMSRHFGEIHGVDVSEEMIRRAREKLRDIPHAHAHHTERSDLAAFADESFDLVYSYAVFQHIPDRAVVFGYLREARRVLKTGGLLRCQFNGLPAVAGAGDTWNGVRVSAGEAAAFARKADFQLLALEGAGTQYLWATCRKQPAGWRDSLGRRGEAPPRIRRITNAHSSEPVAPVRGRFAALAVWMEDLPADCDLNHLRLRIGGAECAASYLGPAEPDGLQQLNVPLPEGLAGGLQPIEILWLDEPLCPPATVRLVRPGPPVPRLVAVTDGIDLLSDARIVHRSVKLVVEEVERPDQLRVRVSGSAVADMEWFCVNPRIPTWEVNFPLPDQILAGSHTLELELASRRLAPVLIEVV